jgi:uncharacterized protein
VSKPKNHRQKSNLPKHEVRVIKNTRRTEVRKNADGSSTAVGYFATYGTKSHPMPMGMGTFFVEVIAPGAFDSSLRANPVSCFVDHNPEKCLGRTESGTLRISSDSVGLRFSVDLAKGVSFSDDLAIQLARGDAYENSFAFSIDGPEGESWQEQPDGTYLRTVKKAVLYEGSILTGNPAAYPGTSVNLRNLPSSLRAKLNLRDDSGQCEDGQHYDSDLGECVDDDDSDSDDDAERSMSYRRCSFRCSQHRDLDAGWDQIAGFADDDDSVRCQARCAMRCGSCERCLAMHSNLQEDNLAMDDVRAAHRRLLALR